MYTLPTGARYLSAFLLLAGLTLLWSTPSAYAQIPQNLSYQGFLTDSQGGSVPDGSYELTVAFYDTATGGTALWTETQTVSTVGGVFSVLLGSTNPLTLPFDRAYWLGTSIDGEPELEPRAPLSAAPYSLTNRGTVNEPASGDSFTVRRADGGTAHVLSPDGNVTHTGKGSFDGGLVVGDTTITVPDSLLLAGKGYTEGQMELPNIGLITGGIEAGVLAHSEGGFGVYGRSTSLTGVLGTSETSIGVQGKSGSGVGVSGSSTSSDGMRGESTSGIGVQGISTENDGVVGKSTSGDGVFGESTSSQGVIGISQTSTGTQGQSTSGVGVFGTSESGSGVVGRSTSGVAGDFQGRVSVSEVPEDAQNERCLVWGTDNVLKYRTCPSGGEGDGIWVLTDGVATTANSVRATSTQGTASAIVGTSTDGLGVRGVSSSSRGVQGESTSSIGVFGTSTEGVGVQGESASNVGVFGASTSSNGVQGKSTSGTGTQGISESNDGVQGSSTSGTGTSGLSESGSGIFGRSTSGLAGEFRGRVLASDVPEDPTNERCLVWGTDNVLKYRTCPSGGEGDGIWVLSDGVATTANAVSATSSQGTSAAVKGTSTDGPGVRGVSSSNRGVQGESTSSVGVFGTSTEGVGVQGESASSVGVFGSSMSSDGVQGKSTSGTGARGISESGVGVLGTSTESDGVQGTSVSAQGVQGQSTSSAGVFGVSESSDGVLGQSTSGSGVRGASDSGSGVFGQSTSGAAGRFVGRVEITTVPEDQTNARMLVWGSDNVVKWRTVPSSENDGIWLLTDGVAATANEVQVTTGQGTPISVLDSEGIKVVDGAGATLGGLGRTELDTGQRLGVFGRAATSSDLAGLFDGKVEITGMLEVEDVPNDPQNERCLVWGTDSVVKYRTCSSGGDGIWVLVGDVATSETAVQVGGALNTTGPLTVQTDLISSFPGGTHTVLGNGNIARTEPTEGYSIRSPGGDFITHNDPNGNAFFSGNLFAGSKSFRIDHPLDPTNRYLQHVSIESPDMMNVYNGNITTDGQGFATVTLPDYFEALNRDFRYQLTVIGTFAQAIIGEEIEGNRFVIQTSEPNVKVSWQVTGVRQDPWAERNRVQVEPLKPSAQRGTYLHGEAREQQ